MDFFNSLWEDPEQTHAPSAHNFAQDLTTEKWLNHSSTYKLISGTFKHPHECLGIEEHFNDNSKKRSNPSADRITYTMKKPVLVKKQKKNKMENITETAENDENSNDDVESEAESSSSEDHQYIPGLRKHPVKDKLSCMDSYEHAECLSLFLKFSKYTGNAIMLSDRSEHFKFQVMYKKIQDEQLAFSQDALNQWPATAKETQNISESNLRPLQTIWMLKAKKALDLYPHVYKRRLMVPLLPGDMKVEMMKTADLLQMGKIPAFFHPQLIKRTVPSTKISKMLKSTQYNLQPDEVVGSLHKLPVSLDPNAESFARLHKAQIVISSGALNTLLETYFDFSKSWTLPITVKEYRTHEKGKATVKTIVFIDKPLPKPSMTSGECHRFIFKHGAKGRLLDSKHSMCFTFPIPGVEPLEREHSSNCDEPPAQPPAQPPANDNMNISSDGDNADDRGDDSDDSAVEKLVIEEEPFEQSKTSQRKDVPTDKNKQSVPTPPSSTPKSTATCTLRKQEPYQRKDGLKLPKTTDGFTAPLSHTNAIYSLWVIKPENGDQLSVHQKKVLKELTVVVRCRVDGCQRVDGELIPLSISPKLEYQMEFAAEEPTKEELVREWASLFFKPVSHVLRTRIDVKDSEVIMCEKKDKFQITADAQRMHGIRLSDSLQTLYAVFSEVSSLTKGSYLLNHSPEENTFASLEESIDEVHENSKSVRNLKNCFSQKLSVSFEPNLAWRKLDCSLVLPRHKFLMMMPCTYRPKPSAKQFQVKVRLPREKKPNGPPSFPTKKKKKKKSKKNRKKQQQNNIVDENE